MAPSAAPVDRGDDRAPDREAERGLRGLVGAGSSQVSVGAALRARDAARPTDEDLAAAAAELVIVRRGWVPREPLAR
ncbi:MAG TPA: hypothetical protein VFM55_09495 [Micromonosporaceae bacterium]|nr:hypothetical protein [Micromonosporaceae bacterium]